MIRAPGIIWGSRLILQKRGSDDSSFRARDLDDVVAWLRTLPPQD
jgi:hypothetical protein